MKIALAILSSLFSLILQTEAQTSEASPSASPKPSAAWPTEIKEVVIKSSADSSNQPALFYTPASSEAVPLLVNLHTWSSDYHRPEIAYANWCLKKGWAFVRPNFRGPNNKPEACGSELAVQDIVDAVHYAQANAKIDPDRIYLIGASGGGYASLLLAGRHPEIWAAVSAWCPIQDLAAWHQKHVVSGQPDKYGRNLEEVCGGAPGANPAVDEEYRKRSASAWMAQAKGVPLDINAGILDGHRGSVPVSHSLNAFNQLAANPDRIPEELIEILTAKTKVPDEVRWTVADPLYQRGPVLFRKISGPVRVTLFNGGHQIFPEAGLAWLAHQRKGQPADWDIQEQPDPEISSISSEANK